MSNLCVFSAGFGCCRGIFVRSRESFLQYNDTQLASDLLSSCTMNVVKPSRAVINSSLPKAAPSSKVNLYQEIPNLEVSLDDFEEFALDRLKVSRRFDCLPENMKPKKKQHTRRRSSILTVVVFLPTLLLGSEMSRTAKIASRKTERVEEKTRSLFEKTERLEQRLDFALCFAFSILPHRRQSPLVLGTGSSVVEVAAWCCGDRQGGCCSSLENGLTRRQTLVQSRTRTLVGKDSFGNSQSRRYQGPESKYI